MPQMRFWPFMARTMVEDVHGVKPLPLRRHTAEPAKHAALQAHTARRLGATLANATNRERRDSEFLIRLWGLTQPCYAVHLVQQLALSNPGNDTIVFV
jgi:hypothetical protein